jgi:hypothetical protein
MNDYDEEGTESHSGQLDDFAQRDDLVYYPQQEEQEENDPGTMLWVFVFSVTVLILRCSVARSFGFFQQEEEARLEEGQRMAEQQANKLKEKRRGNLIYTIRKKGLVKVSLLFESRCLLC